MSRNNNDGGGLVALAILVILGVGFMLVSAFSDFWHLNLVTGLKVLVSWVVASVVYFASLHFFRYSDSLTFRGSVAFYLAALWMGFWPALNYWAAQSIPSFLHDEATT